MAKVTLGEVAVECRESCRGDKSGLPAVGLEHLTPGQIRLSSWAVNTENTFTKLFRRDDMLFGRRRAYLKKAAQAPFDGICSGDITVIRARPGKLLPELLPFIIQNDDLFDFAVGRSDGSLSPRVKWENLKNYTFELPPLAEQKKLAEVLWSISDTIQAYQDLLTKTEELVQARFVEMFGDLKTNPKGWPVVSFPEFAEIDSRMTTDYEKYADYPHVGIDSIEKGTGALKGYRTVREDGVISGKYIFTPQHIIYSKIRPNLNKVALPDFDGLCSADAYPILPNRNNCDRVFLATVLRSEYFLKYILQFSSRTNLPKVNRKEIVGFCMPLPPIELQQQFAAFAAQADQSKFALQRTITSLQETKRSLAAEALCMGRKE